MLIDLNYGELTFKDMLTLAEFNFDFLKAVLLEDFWVEPGLQYKYEGLFDRQIMNFAAMSPFLSQNIMYSNQGEVYIVDPGHETQVSKWRKNSKIGPELWSLRSVGLNILGLTLCGVLFVYGKSMGGKIH